MKRSYEQLSSQQQKQQIVQMAPNLHLDRSILSRTNQKIQKKCPDIYVDVIVDDKKKPYKLRLVLLKERKEVSAIKITVSDHSITIASDTYDRENRQKKYNSVLRYVVILLASTMKYRSFPIQMIHSNAINWKSAKALFQRKFVPTQIFSKDLKVLPITRQILQTIQNTQQLKQKMSGDQQDERKPWLFVLMELDLSAVDRSNLWSSLSNAINTMIC
jgi:hypothetical protein